MILFKYLEDKVQRIRTECGGLEDGEIDAIMSKCAQFKEVETHPLHYPILYNQLVQEQRCTLSNAV